MAAAVPAAGFITNNGAKRRHFMSFCMALQVTTMSNSFRKVLLVVHGTLFERETPAATATGEVSESGFFGARCNWHQGPVSYSPSCLAAVRERQQV